MSSTRGVQTLVGLALASSVILLGGCSSSGTITGSGLSAADASAAAVGGQSGGAAGGTTGGADDPGCKAALSDETSALKSIDAGDLNSAKDGFKNLADKLHADAGQSKIPAAAAAITKLGDDYATMATSSSPDDTASGNDSEAVGKACE
jgi:hypothetical protein